MTAAEDLGGRDLKWLHSVRGGGGKLQIAWHDCVISSHKVQPRFPRNTRRELTSCVNYSGHSVLCVADVLATGHRKVFHADACPHRKF